MAQNESLKRQLQTLKRELKGWEAMFERKHGYRPTKTDIEESPNEIKETYQEYKKVKSHLSREGTEETKMKRVHFEDGVECQRSSPPAHTKEDGVFGISPNKKPKKKKTNRDAYLVGRGEGERRSVWKLYRWSKSCGHHTVVVENRGEGEGERREEERGGCEQMKEEKGKEVTESGPKTDGKNNESLAQMDRELTVELEQLSQGVHFRDLTTSQQEQYPPLLNPSTQDKEPEDGDSAALATPVPMARQCSSKLNFKMAVRSPTKSKTQGGAATMCVRRLMHCQSVSQRWLERCKPDLAEFEQPSDNLSDNEGAEVERTSEEESENEIEHVSDLEDSDGVCEDLWEEEDEEEEGQGVEPQSFDLEHVHNEGEEHYLHHVSNDLNRIVGHCDWDLDDTRGYSWDDNDERSSDDDSSSEDDPVIKSCLGEEFETKWEELSKSVTTLSLLKQLAVKPSSSETTCTSQSSKKRLILAPRATPTCTSSQSSRGIAKCHTSATESTTFASSGAMLN